MKKIIVFGKGNYYRLKEKSLKNIYEIVAFIDNNANSISSYNDEGIPVFFPDDVLNLRYDMIVIMASRSTSFDMLKQLKKMGISDDMIFSGMNIEPAFDSNELILQENDIKVVVENGNFVFNFDGEKYVLDEYETYKKVFNKIKRLLNPIVETITEMPLTPLSRIFGYEFGDPIDRYYIEKFLAENKSDIKGDVAEIAENRYIKKFGQSVNCSYIFHVEGWNGCKKVNLETGEGVEDGLLDCLILTQTIQMIFDLNAVAKNIRRLLKKNGVALITVSSISPISMKDYEQWGEMWRFTEQSIRKLFINNGFRDCEIETRAYGNMKVAIGFLYGLCKEDFTVEDLDYYDKQFPLTISCKIIKGDEY